MLSLLKVLIQRMLIVILLIYSIPIFSQQKNALDAYLKLHNDAQFPATYWKGYVVWDSTYRCEEGRSSSGRKIPVKVVGSEAFDSLIRPALSNIFVGSNDLITNATASSFTQDDKAGTLNLNYAKLTKNQNVFNVGAFSKSTNGIFGIYTGNSWSNDVGLSLGFSFKTNSFLRDYTYDNCDQLKTARRLYILSFIRNLQKLAEYDIEKMRTDSQRIADNEAKVLTSTEIPDKKTDEEAGVKAQLDSVLKVYNTYVDPLGNYLPEDQYLEAEVLIDSLLLEKWEIKNAAFFKGYTIRWITTNFSISNNTLSLNTDSLPSLSKKDYKNKSFIKLSLGAGYSYQSSRKKVLWYISFGSNAGLHHYMDYPTYINPSLHYDSVGKLLYVVSDNKDSVGRYADIKPNIITVEPYFNASLFFWDKKQFGWNFRFDCAVVANGGDKKDLYRNYFNALTGPLFRLNSDKSVSSGTIGLDIGFSNCAFKSNAWNSFAFKFKIGVPFNALVK